MIKRATTRLTLPQFHVIYNNFFETVQGEQLTKDIMIKWKILAGFYKVSNRTTIGEINVISKSIS